MMSSDPNIPPQPRKGAIFLLTPMTLWRRIARMQIRSEKVTVTSSKRLEKQIKDFASGGLALVGQRQGIYFGAALLCAFFYDFWLALPCYAFCQLAELADSLVSLRVKRWAGGSPRMARRFLLQLLGTSALSAVAVGLFTLLVAKLEGPGEHFTSLFFLFAAGLFAAVNNHQLPKVLAVRLVIYGAVFLYIPIADIVNERPPFRSQLWLHFATVLFVLYFVLECSMIFLRLYQRGLDQYEELRIERDRAQEIYELKSQFVSVVSHELRTPLTSIIGALGLMKSKSIASNPEGFEKILGIANKNSKRLSNLINDLLDLQKLESKQMHYSYGHVDPVDVVYDSVEAISAHADSKGVQIRIVEETPNLSVHGDYDRLVQVLDNLLSNAVKFSHKGGTIEVSVASGEGMTKIHVRDYGVGIPESSHEVVFAKFSQVDGSDHRAHEGTGLGLNIVKQILRAHKAEIDYVSELGEGSTFTVTIPLHTPEAEG